MAQSTEEVAEQLARHVVHGVAPEEDEIFDLVAAAWRRDPGRLADKATRDEMLGFGVEAALTLLTPVALGAATEVLRYLATETADALELQKRVDKLLRRDPDGPAPLDRDQLASVREIVLAKCKQAEVTPERAEQVADAVVGALSADD